MTGLVSGQVVRVWRDSSSGMVFQRGGWSYVLVLLGLLAARILIYIVLYRMGIAGRRELAQHRLHLPCPRQLSGTHHQHPPARNVANEQAHASLPEVSVHALDSVHEYEFTL